MARLTVIHSSATASLLAHAAQPFAGAAGAERVLPLLAVRQGGIRDQIRDLTDPSGTGTVSPTSAESACRSRRELSHRRRLSGQA